MIQSKNQKVGGKKVINSHTVYILREGHTPKTEISLSIMLRPKIKYTAGVMPWGPTLLPLPAASSSFPFSSILSTLSFPTQTLVFSS